MKVGSIVKCIDNAYSPFKKDKLYKIIDIDINDEYCSLSNLDGTFDGWCVGRFVPFDPDMILSEVNNEK